LLYFIISFFICQLYFTIHPPQFPCHHLLTAATPLATTCPSSISTGYESQWKYLPSSQYWWILGNTQCPNNSIVVSLPACDGQTERQTSRHICVMRMWHVTWKL